ncbi:hypothetical protein [Archangium gephyra]|uniref:hypothetical protein n=1 Tax=Archangium gephyra TaxID=48 RepID=UPI0006497010|nr:hypothetical protein [Archangium gephyra]
MPTSSRSTSRRGLSSGSARHSFSMSRVRDVIRAIWLSRPVARMPHADTITAGVTAAPMTRMEEMSMPPVASMPLSVTPAPAWRKPGRLPSHISTLAS